MKKSILIFSAGIGLTFLFGISTVLAGPVPTAPYQVNIDDESILEDDPDFFDNPPLWQLKSYKVYPVLQRHKLDKTLKIVKFKANFEYVGETISEDFTEQPVIGTAMCKVPDPYYFYDTKIVYKGSLPLQTGQRVNVTILIPFPTKVATQLKKNPASCNVVVNDAEDFPVQYGFEVRRVGREFVMTFRGTNTDQAPALDDDIPAPTAPPANMPTADSPSPTPPTPPNTPTAILPPAVTREDHIRGQMNAPVTLIEYSDPDCPFCQRFHPIMKKLLASYNGKVRWVYRHFPLSIHPNAQEKAQASECADELGGADTFWKFTDQLLENNPDVTELSGIAETLGLNKQAFTTCVKSGKYKKLVSEHMDGGTLAGVSGTPQTFVLGPNGFSSQLMGALPYEMVEEEVQRALKP